MSFFYLAQCLNSKTTFVSDYSSELNCIVAKIPIVNHSQKKCVFDNWKYFSNNISLPNQEYCIRRLFNVANALKFLLAINKSINFYLIWNLINLIKQS